jgi:hypothetical protein
MVFKRSKFKIDRSDKGKQKRTFEGKEFDSVMELQFYTQYLLPLKEKGIVKNIELQPKYVLQEGFTKNGKRVLPIQYISDYLVEFSDGTVITYDVKGLPTVEARLKKKMFDYKFPDKTLIWISLSIQDGGWIEYDELCKLRAKRKKEKKNNAKDNVS